MIKSIKRFFQQRRERYRIPRRVQDLIPIDGIWNDGIFHGGNAYSKTYRFSDINYKVASDEDQHDMFLGYSAILNGLDGNSAAQILIYNHRMNRWNFSESVLMPMKGDGRDEYREEYNGVVSGKSRGTSFIQEKYITVSAARKNLKEARLFFDRTDTDLRARFAALDSRCVGMNAQERLRLLHSFYRPKESDSFHFDMKKTFRWGHDFRDYICPDSVERHSDYLKIGDRYARVLFLKELSSFVKDDFIDELVTRDQDMMVAINILPIRMDEAIRYVENRLLGVETNITNWQRHQNANNNFSATVPYELELQRQELKEFLNDLMTRDQRMMQTVVTMVITADTKEELDNETESIRTFADNRMCQIGTLTFQQMDALNTTLPLGVWKLNVFRTLTTEALAVLMPFKVQEIQDLGGLYFGENAISHNLILCNRGLLLNQSAFFLGVPGSGKSFLTKLLILILILTTDDDILICDPEGEYVPIVEALSGEMASVIRLHAGGRDRLNVMFMVSGYGEEDPIASKSQFIMSLVERIDKKGVGPKHQSIIDRCVAAVYREGERTGRTPTLAILREELMRQPEELAQDIALDLELFTSGSQDIFGHESNVDLTKRITVFDIHKLSAQLKAPGLQIVTDTMLNRVTQNWAQGKRTHIFIDEFHVAFENESSAEFFDSAWRQFRKRNAYPTAITQNVDYLLDSPKARSMISNSEFIVMLNQSAPDREKLANLLNISDAQLSYITNAEAGSGLIKCGSALVPFENHFPKDTKLYQLMTTKPGEGIFGGDNKEIGG